MLKMTILTPQTLTQVVGYDFKAVTQPDNNLLNTYRSIFSPSRAGRLLAVAGIFLPTWAVQALP